LDYGVFVSMEQLGRMVGAWVLVGMNFGYKWIKMEFEA